MLLLLTAFGEGSALANWLPPPTINKSVICVILIADDFHLFSLHMNHQPSTIWQICHNTYSGCLSLEKSISI